MADETETPIKPSSDEAWPNSPDSREALDEALEQGFASGRSPLSHDEIIAEARKALGLG